MVRTQSHSQAPSRQLRRINRFNFFSRLEVAELPKLLMPDEQVLGVIGGFYSAGTAILCVTSKRLLLIDKKFFRLSYEDVRFDAINEVIYSHQLLLATAKFYITGRDMHFRTWYRRELQIMIQFVQNKMFEARGEAKSEEVGLQEPSVAQPASTATTSQPVSPLNPQLERYLQERVARWRRASRFIDALPSVRAQAGAGSATTFDH